MLPMELLIAPWICPLLCLPERCSLDSRTLNVVALLPPLLCIPQWQRLVLFSTESGPQWCAVSCGWEKECLEKSILLPNPSKCLLTSQLWKEPHCSRYDYFEPWSWWLSTEYVFDCDIGNLSSIVSSCPWRALLLWFGYIEVGDQLLSVYEAWEGGDIG